MNCKPGDLAVIVRSERAPEHIGKIVTCVRPHIFLGVECWEITPTLKNSTGGTAYWAVPDRQLRPIRDPGDDAQDETLEWLPVPRQDEVAA